MSDHEHPSEEALWLADDTTVVSHLEACSRCRQVAERRHGEQDAIRDLLAAHADAHVEPMPADVRHRLDSALRTESAHAATAPATHTSTDPDGPTGRRGRTAFALAASFAGLVVVGGALVIPALDDGAPAPAQSDSAQAEAGAVESAPRDEQSVDEAGVPALPAELLLAATETDAAETNTTEADATGTDSRGTNAGGIDPSLPTECGSALVTSENASEIERALPVPDDRGGVLVVVRTDDDRAVWWLPTCASSPSQALGRSALP